MSVGSRDVTAALLLVLALAAGTYVLVKFVGLIPATFAIAFVSVFIWANRSIVDVPPENPLLKGPFRCHCQSRSR